MSNVQMDNIQDSDDQDQRMRDLQAGPSTVFLGSNTKRQTRKENSSLVTLCANAIRAPEWPGGGGGSATQLDKYGKAGGGRHPCSKMALPD